MTAFRCPLCGTQLIKTDGGFRHRGTVVRKCPDCKGIARSKPQLSALYRDLDRRAQEREQ